MKRNPQNEFIISHSKENELESVGSLWWNIIHMIGLVYEVIVSGSWIVSASNIVIENMTDFLCVYLLRHNICTQDRPFVWIYSFRQLADVRLPESYFDAIVTVDAVTRQFVVTILNKLL